MYDVNVMVKKNKLSASLEDYLEAIYLIERERGVARSREIMEQLSVSGPSVTEALQLLNKKGLIHYQPYEPITLSTRGKEVAREIFHRHETLRNFFIEILGIDRKTADKGACKMEHAASANIIERMVQYTSYLKKECTGDNRVGIDGFQIYLKKTKSNNGNNTAGCRK